jgi:uncharacterized protein YceK
MVPATMHKSLRAHGKTIYEREQTMTGFRSNSLHRSKQLFLVSLALLAIALSGCASMQEKALDQAKKQAVATGQAQQVVSVDKNGITTTTIVQPPVPGQNTTSITTTTTASPMGATPPAFSRPKVSAVPLPPIPTNATIPAGTTLTIRIDQRLSVKGNRAGDRFTGKIVDPVLTGDNSVLVPKGALVAGIVDVSHKRGHFKGRSFLELRLTSMTLNGAHYSLTTRDLVRTKKGKGKRSTAFIAGGSGLGMLIGGLASGGTGVAVGGLVGGGAGTAVAGMTGNRDIDIPAESIVHFKLAADLVVQLAK